jgi:hypothetical protein
MNKELLKTIELPEGFVIDKDKSTDTKIVIKAIKEERPRCKTYEEIQFYNMGKRKQQFRFDQFGDLDAVIISPEMHIGALHTHVPSYEIAAKIIALCQLYVIAEYYNDGWVPDWKNDREMKFYAAYDHTGSEQIFKWSWNIRLGTPVFREKRLLEEAYTHNKEIFKKALEI